MASKLRTWARYASWLLPHGVHVVRERWRNRRMRVPELVSASALEINAELYARHKGERCFILGNGPSAKSIDLSELAGETIFSVSNGYLHAGYEAAAPRYHCVPQITYGRMTEADVVAWFQEMHTQIGDAELFLNETEAAVVARHGLFAGRKIRYLAFRESFDDVHGDAVIDISKPVPRVESVPVMVLMIAMYMGFEEIVLLGVDHDHFLTKKYVYAFDPEVQKGKDYSVSSNGDLQISRHDDFQSLARLWRQYRVLSQIATANGIRVSNASVSSELDEFPRISIEKVTGAHR